MKKKNQEEVAVITRKRAILQQKIKESEAAIEKLITDKARGRVEQEEYEMGVAVFKAERQNLRDELRNYDDNKDNWIENAEAAFQFAKNAREAFAKGDIKTRRLIFASLGSKFILRDKKLTLELKKPLQSIQNGMKLLKGKIGRFEIAKDDSGTTSESHQVQVKSIWSG